MGKRVSMSIRSSRLPFNGDEALVDGGHVPGEEPEPAVKRLPGLGGVPQVAHEHIPPVGGNLQQRHHHHEEDYD